MGSARELDEVHRITDAPEPLSQDLSRRSRRYLIQMAIRTVCFVLAVVTTGPMRWIFLAGAVVLPYFAVLLANAGREHEDPALTAMTPLALPSVAHDALPSPRDPRPGPDQAPRG